MCIRCKGMSSIERHGEFDLLWVHSDPFGCGGFMKILERFFWASICMRCRVLIISCKPPVLHTLVECSDVIVCDNTELLRPCTSSDYPIQPPFCFRLMPSHTSEEPLRACLLWNKMPLTIHGMWMVSPEKRNLSAHNIFQALKRILSVSQDIENLRYVEHRY